MGKILYEDKARIETLQKLGFGYRTIVAKFPEKGWKLCSVKAICKRVDGRGSATERKPGSARPKTARTFDGRGSATERKPGSARPKTA